MRQCWKETPTPVVGGVAETAKCQAPGKARTIYLCRGGMQVSKLVKRTCSPKKYQNVIARF